jgi:precorrin-6Y C5,15-methyltransferase (decarboxylating)
VLSSDQHTPTVIADLLTGAGFGRTSMTVLGDLGTPEESRAEGVAADWAATDLSRLNLVCLKVSPDPGTAPRPTVAGLPDSAFEHDGQLTKRDLRASALARLTPVPGQLLWDVGAGAGSVAVEWMRTDPRCRAIAVERDPDRAARIGRNADALGVPGLRVVTGPAPVALAGLPVPDAIFVGGGATVPDVIEICWAALAPEGRLVVHAVTLETEAILFDRYKSLGGELVRLSIEHAAPIGTFTGWTPARTVTQWAITKRETS